VADPQPLKWLFEIYDKMSGPGKQITVTMTAVDKALQNVTASTVKLESKGGDSLKGFAGHFALISAGVQVAVGALEELGEKIFQIGSSFIQSTISAIGFEQQSKVAFTALTGSATQANEILQETKRFALDAALPLKTVEDAYRSLLLGGIRKDNIRVVLEASADISNLQGTGAAGTAAIAQTFAGIKSMGQLTGRSLAAFKGAIDFDVLAEKLGHAGVGFTGLKKILSESPVGADKGIVAILETIAARTGAVGGVTKKFADTIPGTIERIKTGWEEMLGGFADSPAFTTLQASFAKLARYFDPFTEEGKKTQVLVTKLLDTITKLVDKVLADPDAIGKFFTTAYDTANKLIGVIEPIAKAFGFIWDHKEAIGAGVAANAVGGPVAAIAAAGLVESARGAAEIKAELGNKGFSQREQSEFTGKGLERFAEGGYVDTPRVAHVGEVPEWIIPVSKMRSASPGGGGGVVINLSQQITVEGANKRDAEETGHIIARVSQGDLQPALEAMMLSLGVA
jgi:hypothetical protein